MTTATIEKPIYRRWWIHFPSRHVQHTVSVG